jgi:hypothetical protein
MMDEINTLKQELQALMELQKGIMMDGQSNANNKSRCTVNMNVTCEPINLSILQHMENFIVVDDKIILVDNEKNLYHLKRCKKYEGFLKQCNFETKEEAFNAYIEQFNQQKDKEVSQLDSILESEQEIVKIDDIPQNNEKKDFTDFNLSDSS